MARRIGARWWRVAMISTAEEFVRLRTSEIPDEYSRAAHDDAPEQVWMDVIDNYPDMRKWVAHNKTIPLSILQLLAADNDPEIRHMVAMKRKLSRELFQILAQDSDETVRVGVVNNAKTPKEILEWLAHDKSAHIAKLAQERLEKTAPEP